jgi:hypothetical protein
VSAPSSAPDEEAFRQDPPPRGSPDRSRKRNLAKLAGALVLFASVLAVLVIGVAIGNATRKRIDRWTHGY